MLNLNAVLKSRSALDSSEFILISGLVTLFFAAFISSCNATVDQNSIARERHDRQRVAASATTILRPIDEQWPLSGGAEDVRITSVNSASNTLLPR